MSNGTCTTVLYVPSLNTFLEPTSINHDELTIDVMESEGDHSTDDAYRYLPITIIIVMSWHCHSQMNSAHWLYSIIFTFHCSRTLTLKDNYEEFRNYAQILTTDSFKLTFTVSIDMYNIFF